MPDSVGKKSVFERELGWSGLGVQDSNSIHLLLVQKSGNNQILLSGIIYWPHDRR